MLSRKSNHINKDKRTYLGCGGGGRGGTINGCQEQCVSARTSSAASLVLLQGGGSASAKDERLMPLGEIPLT